MPPADFQALRGKRFKDSRLIPISIAIGSAELRPVGGHGFRRHQEEAQNRRQDRLEKEGYKTGLRHSRYRVLHTSPRRTVMRSDMRFNIANAGVTPSSITFHREQRSGVFCRSVCPSRKGRHSIAGSTSKKGADEGRACTAITERSGGLDSREPPLT